MKGINENHINYENELRNTAGKLSNDELLGRYRKSITRSGLKMTNKRINHIQIKVYETELGNRLARKVPKKEGKK